MDLSAEVPPDMTVEELRIELARARSARTRLMMIAAPPAAAVLLTWALIAVRIAHGELPRVAILVEGVVLVVAGLSAAVFVALATRSQSQP